MTVSHGVQGQLISEARNCIYSDIKALTFWFPWVYLVPLACAQAMVLPWLYLSEHEQSAICFWITEIKATVLTFVCIKC